MIGKVLRWSTAILELDFCNDGVMEIEFDSDIPQVCIKLILNRYDTTVEAPSLDAFECIIELWNRRDSDGCPQQITKVLPSFLFVVLLLILDNLFSNSDVILFHLHLNLPRMASGS